MQRKYGAYFTVEAALVLPMILGCILLLVYIAIFQYDRCTMEMDLNHITLLAASAGTDDHHERMEVLEQYAQKVSKEKFLAWETGGNDFRIRRGKVETEVWGKVRFPFKLPMNDVDEKGWEVRAKSKCNIIDPATFVRNYANLIKAVSRKDS